MKNRFKERRVNSTRKSLNNKCKKYNNNLVKIDDIILQALKNRKIGEAISLICDTFNKCVTRVDENHFLIKNKKIYHRALRNPKLKENSKEAVIDCINYNVPFEIDVTLYNGRVVLYHDDTYSDKLGQEKSLAEKENIKDSTTLEEILNLVDGKVPIVIDLKAYSIFDRTLEKEVLKLVYNYDGEFTIQSFNPLSLKFFAKYAPHIVRGQLGNSLTRVKDKKKLRSILLLVINFVLFYRGYPDYIVYDLDETVKSLVKINNIIGLPIIGYTAFSIKDIIKYKLLFNSFFVEGWF